MQGERDGRETPPVAEAEATVTANGAAEEETTVEEGAPAPAAGGANTELAEARARAADFEDRWKRAAAEFANYKRRTEQDRVTWFREANAGLITEFLPVLDDLERALANVPPGEAESKWVEGVRLVERKYRGVLERQGVAPIEAVGQPFDPALHEAVGGSGETVTQEFRRGYTLHGRVLRPAMVVVGEAAEGAPAEQAEPAEEQAEPAAEE